MTAQIAKHPIAAVIVALLVGVVVGHIVEKKTGKVSEILAATVGKLPVVGGLV